jgi:DNA-binding transcriptional LysR family regulator
MSRSASDLDLLRRFARTPEGRALVEVLNRMLAQADEALRFGGGEELYRCQGRAQQLQQLIEDLTKAEQHAAMRDVSNRPRKLVNFEP